MAKPIALTGQRLELELDSTITLAALACVGIATAIATAYVKLHLGISGHAIVLTVAPTVLGVGLFPRRWAGTTIACSALVTALALRFTGGALVGPSALTAFVATGVLVDAVMSRRWSGLPLYAALIGAGLLANVAAFGAHLIETAAIGVIAGGKPWIVQIASYAACGGAAGALSAALAFQLRPKRARD